MGNYRGSVKGFYTDKRRRYGRKVVRPISPRKSKQSLSPQRVVHLSVPKRLASFSINHILTILDGAFPNLIPIFETGRFLINNKELITKLNQTLFSDKTTEKKIETVENELIGQVEEKLSSEFSKNSATTVSNILQEHGYFEFVSKELNKEHIGTDANLLHGFFQNTLEGLISASITGAFGVAK
jgi:hypothetical protein